MYLVGDIESLRGVDLVTVEANGQLPAEETTLSGNRKRCSVGTSCWVEVGIVRRGEDPQKFRHSPHLIAPVLQLP